MAKIIEIIHSPFPEHNSEPLPWQYDEKGFLSWIYGVFMMDGGFELNDVVEPTLEEAIELVETIGYKVKVTG